MKCIVIIISSLLSFSLWAQNRQILKCLGEEEKRFHLKKETGPVYDLNQRMIAEIVQIPRVELNNEDYRRVCSSGQFSESWKLLELSIKKGKEIFIIPDSISGPPREMAKGMVDDYVDATRGIFLNFVAQIQTISPTPTCLQEEIPELKNFFIEVKYLQEDVDLKQIFKGKDQKIFDQLKNYPSAFEKCRARLKKKLRPVSTAPTR